MKLFGFDLLFGHVQNGVKPPERKLTEKKVIEKGPMPGEVIIPLSQHIGAPCKSVVKRNQEVKVGELIGEPGGFVSAPIHSTVSGKVLRTSQMVNPVTGKPVDTVIIETDGKDEWAEPMKTLDLKKATVEELLGRIKEAGIVGLGGATFPTHVKLSPPPGKVIRDIIVNGCECEPYITSDHRLLLEKGKELLKGLKIIMKVLSCDRSHIAIEDNKPDAIKHISDLVVKYKLEKKVSVVSVKSKYPMGAEKTLAKYVLGKEVPMGGLPFDIGVLIQNVGTIIAIHDAVHKGKPLVERVMTITGEVNGPKNITVRFGTPISTLLEYCGGMSSTGGEVIGGGAMMGIAQYDLENPVTKGTNCILVKKKVDWEERDCIKCSRCIDACPMGLLPTKYAKLVKVGRFRECEDFYIENCVECGSCTYSCPAKIPLVQYIKVGKAQLAKIKRKEGN